MSKKYSGFTLLELILTLFIGALLLSFAIPTSVQLVRQAHSRMVQRTLLQALAATKQASIASHQVATLCPSTDRHHCADDWQLPWVIFVGSDKPGEFDIHSKLVRVIPSINYGKLQLKAYPDANYLRFTPMGYTDHQNGTFTYNNGSLSWSVVVNRVGHVRFS